MSARRGAQLVPFKMPTICWETFSAKTTIMSTRNSNIMMMSFSECLLLESSVKKYKIFVSVVAVFKNSKVPYNTCEYAFKLVVRNSRIRSFRCRKIE